MNRVSIVQDRQKTLWFLLLAYTMLAISIGACYFKPTMFFFTAGILGIAFSAIAFFYLLYRLLNPREILVIDSDGFIDTSSAMSVGFVPWSNVKRIFLGKDNGFSPAFGKDHICITLHDTEAVLSCVPALKRSMINTSISSGNPPIIINLDLSSEKEEVAYKMMKEYYEKSLAFTKRII